MSDEHFKRSVWERIHRAEEEYAVLSDRHDELSAEVQEFAARKSELAAKIANWQELVTDAEENEGGTSDTVSDSKPSVSRRMRLGSK